MLAWQAAERITCRHNDGSVAVSEFAELDYGERSEEVVPKNRIKSLMNHYEPCVSSTSEPAASCSAPPEVNLVIYRVGLGLVQTGNCWPSVRSDEISVHQALECTRVSRPVQELTWSQYADSNPNNPVHQLVFSPNCRHLAYIRHGYQRIDCEVWDLETGKEHTFHDEKERGGSFGTSTFTPIVGGL